MGKFHKLSTHFMKEDHKSGKVVQSHVCYAVCYIATCKDAYGDFVMR